MNLNFKEIFEGWRNKIIPPEDLKDAIEKVAGERRSICDTCPSQSENAKKNGYKTIRFDVHCTECGCPLAAKTRSLSSSCPLGKWPAVTTEAERAEIEKSILIDDETDEL